MDIKQLTMAMIRIAVCGEAPTQEVKDACTPELLEKVYALAAKHDLAHLVGQTVNKLQLPEDAVVAKCKKAAMSAFVRHTQQEYDLQRLYGQLEAAAIPFLPLKGSVLRSYYPEPWQRTSCDIDILVKKEDICRATELLESNGWKQKGQSSNEVAFTSGGSTVLELHHSLIEAFVSLPEKASLQNVWQYANPLEGKTYHMVLPEQWFYSCHLAHMAKHVIYGGCGIRPFLDLWILEQKIPALALPAGSGLEKFEAAVTKLSRCWFAGEPMDENTALLENYILSGGAYGNLRNQVDMQKIKKGGKGKYILKRIFPPRSEMSGLFPVLQKHPWLTPVFYVVRPFRLLLGGNWKRHTQELELLKNTKQKTAENLMKYLGL